MNNFQKVLENTPSTNPRSVQADFAHPACKINSSDQSKGTSNTMFCVMSICTRGEAWDFSKILSTVTVAF